MFRTISSIHNADDNQSSPATPRNSWKKHATSNNTNGSNSSSSSSKNPYSSRGLEKFTSVLSELEAKKERIMTRIGSDVAMVRFKYSTSQDFIPIVVKIREDGGKKSNPVSPKPEPVPKEQPVSALPAPQLPEAGKKVKKSVRWSGGGKKGGELCRWRPSYSMLLLILLVLVCLMVSGRVFAVCCTAVGWYLVPLLKDQGSHENKRRWCSKKKD